MCSGSRQRHRCRYSPRRSRTSRPAWRHVPCPQRRRRTRYAPTSGRTLSPGERIVEVVAPLAFAGSTRCVIVGVVTWNGSECHGREHTHQLKRGLRRHGVLATMSSVADCFDSALAESVFASLECGLFDQPRGGSPHITWPGSRSSTTSSLPPPSTPALRDRPDQSRSVRAKQRTKPCGVTMSAATRCPRKWVNSTVRPKRTGARSGRGLAATAMSIRSRARHLEAVAT